MVSWHLCQEEEVINLAAESILKTIRRSFSQQLKIQARRDSLETNSQEITWEWINWQLMVVEFSSDVVPVWPAAELSSWSDNYDIKSYCAEKDSRRSRIQKQQLENKIEQML